LIVTDHDANPVVGRVREFAPDAITGLQDFRSELSITIGAAAWRRVGEFLRDDPSLPFKFLSDLTAVDHYPKEPRFEVVCHLFSIARSCRLRLKTAVSGTNPGVDSLVPVWPAADAFEREVFDLFGIRFEGHPELRRILLPEDWEGHPLRKDYPTEGFR
jgi:NADH-quinone oxidoreductase subunit C